MMPFFDYLYECCVKKGKLEGIWNTEAGFAEIKG